MSKLKIQFQMDFSLSKAELYIKYATEFWMVPGTNYGWLIFATVWQAATEKKMFEQKQTPVLYTVGL